MSRPRCCVWFFWWAVLLLLVPSPVVGLGKKLLVEHEIPLEPFQLLYTTKTDATRSFRAGSMDGMSLLEATRKQLMGCFKRDPFFERLTLYFSIRSKQIKMFQNGTKMAYAGNAYYTLPIGYISQKRVISDTLLCFMGENETKYVESLHTMGWDIVERAEIMTIAGDMIESVEGDNVVVKQENNDKEEANDMDKGTSRLIILVAAVLPLSVVLLLGAGYCWYRMCCHVSCRRPRTADERNPIWSVNHPQSQQFRTATLAGMKPGDATSDSESDHASVQVQVSKQPPAVLYQVSTYAEDC